LSPQAIGARERNGALTCGSCKEVFEDIVAADTPAVIEAAADEEFDEEEGL